MSPPSKILIATRLLAPPNGQQMLLNRRTFPFYRSWFSVILPTMTLNRCLFSWTRSLLIQHQVFLIWARSSLQQKAMCQLVIWLLHEAWNSSIKSSARNLHHYSLEVSTLCFLNRNKRSSGHEHCSFKVVYVHTSRVVLFNPCVASGHLRIVLLMLPVILFVF